MFKVFLHTKRVGKSQVWRTLGKFQKWQKMIGICPQALISHSKPMINYKIMKSTWFSIWWNEKAECRNCMMLGQPKRLNPGIVLCWDKPRESGMGITMSWQSQEAGRRYRYPSHGELACCSDAGVPAPNDTWAVSAAPQETHLAAAARGISLNQQFAPFADVERCHPICVTFAKWQGLHWPCV